MNYQIAPPYLIDAIALIAGLACIVCGAWGLTFRPRKRKGMVRTRKLSAPGVRAWTPAALDRHAEAYQAPSPTRPVKRRRARKVYPQPWNDPLDCFGEEVERQFLGETANGRLDKAARRRGEEIAAQIERQNGDRAA